MSLGHYEGDGGNASRSHSEGHKFSEQLHIADHAHAHLGDHVGDTHNHYYALDPVFRKFKAQRERSIRRLFKSLAFPGMDARERHVSMPMATTCAWLDDNDEYKSWMNDEDITQHHGLLCIGGKPGTGKSTIMKYITEKFKQSRPRDLILSYFFNARAASELERSPLGMYRAIVHQILELLPDLKTSFFEKFSSKETSGLITEWTIPELQTFLLDTAQKRSSLYLCLFIDALDEGETQHVRRMVAFLQDFVKENMRPSMKNLFRVCLSSRHFPQITVKRGLSLVLEQQEGHREDIRRFICEKLVVEEEDLAQRLTTTIQNRSSQIFLWVVLVIEILNEMYDTGCTPSTLEKRLADVPAELHSLFKDILMRGQTTMSSVVILFQWLLFAKRPLQPQELYTALKLGLDEEAEEALTPGFVRRYLTQCSRGLVEIIVDEVNGGVFYVQFIHESVRDFLLKENELIWMQDDLARNVEGLSHSMIKLCCFLQLQRIPLESVQGIIDLPCSGRSDQANLLWARYPLLKYAAAYIFEHATIAYDTGIQQQEFLMDFEANDNDLLRKWTLAYELELSRPSACDIFWNFVAHCYFHDAQSYYADYSLLFAEFSKKREMTSAWHWGNTENNHGALVKRCPTSSTTEQTDDLREHRPSHLSRSTSPLEFGSFPEVNGAQPESPRTSREHSILASGRSGSWFQEEQNHHTRGFAPSASLQLPSSYPPPYTNNNTSSRGDLSDSQPATLYETRLTSFSAVDYAPPVASGVQGYKPLFLSTIATSDTPGHGTIYTPPAASVVGSHYTPLGAEQSSTGFLSVPVLSLPQGHKPVNQSLTDKTKPAFEASRSESVTRSRQSDRENIYLFDFECPPPLTISTNSVPGATSAKANENTDNRAKRRKR